MELNIEQRNIVESNPKGHILIKGVAGSGKTTVALHRALYLKQNHCPNPEDRILLVTYNKSLNNYLKYCFENITKESQVKYPNIFSGNEKQVDVNNIDKFISDYYKANSNKDIELVYNNNKETKKHFRACVKEISGKFKNENLITTSNIDFLLDEIDWIKACRYTSLKEYQEVIRLGRMKDDKGTHSIQNNSTTRQAIFELMQLFEQRLKSNHLIFYRDAAIAALDHAKNNPSKIYKHIIIDESQDLSKVQLEFLREVYLDSPDSCFAFVADTAQSIYSHAWLIKGRSFSSIGFDMSGRSNSLNKNYRTSTQVAEAAYSMIEKDIEVTSCDNFVAPMLLDRQGFYPILSKHENEQKETSFICKEIERLIAKGYSYKDIAISARTWGQLNTIKKALEESKIPCRILKNVDARFDMNKIQLISLHSIKGLEFNVIFIVGLNENSIPSPLKNSSIDPAIHKSNERKLLYVGMTRAKELLYLSTYGKPSPFIDDINPDYIRLREESRIKSFYQIDPANYIHTNKIQYIQGEEERVRQWVANELNKTYNYLESMIQFELQRNVFSKKCYIDISVTAYNNPYIFIETKAPGKDIHSAVSQLESYMYASSTCQYGVVTDGNHFLAFKKKPEGLEPADDIPVFHESMRKGFTHNYTYTDFRSNRDIPIKIDFENPNLVTVYKNKHKEDFYDSEIKKIPIRNNMDAERHMVREESPDDYFSLPKEMVNTNREVCFLKVKGDSMIEANIDDGDLLLVEKRSDAKNRDIVAVSYGGQTVIKRYIPAKGIALLLSENTKYEDIKVKNEQARILGVTLGVIKGKGNR